MNNSNFLKMLEERPLRMAAEPELPRPQIVLYRPTTTARTSDRPIAAIVIVGLAFWLVYAFMRSMPV